MLGKPTTDDMNPAPDLPPPAMSLQRMLKQAGDDAARLGLPLTAHLLQTALLSLTEEQGAR